MVRTTRPARVDEVLLDRLLNVINDPPLEVVGIIAEQSNASGRLSCDRFVTVANGLCEIVTKETNQTFYSGL